MLPYLFVYGTLRHGQALHGELLATGAEFAGEGWITGRVWNLGCYPGATEEGDDVIPGELYRLPSPRAALRRLDLVEGGEFRRAAVRVNLAYGTRRAWVYLLKRASPQ